MNCSDVSTALVCYDDGVTRRPLVAHYEYGKNATGATIVAAVRYCEPDGTPVDTSGGIVTAGACPVPAVALVTHGQNFANGTLTADYDPNGNGTTWVQPSGVVLQSVTVIARKTGKLLSGPDRIMVAGLPEGKYFLLEGDVRTWSVSQDASRNEFLSELPIEVYAEGNSAFDVIWTAET